LNHVYEFELMVILPMTEIGFNWICAMFHECRFSVEVGFNILRWIVNSWLENIVVNCHWWLLWDLGGKCFQLREVDLCYVNEGSCLCFGE
jgi:hypothetical protein